MKNEITKHRKKKSVKGGVIAWAFIVTIDLVLVAFVFALIGADSLVGIFGNKFYWLTVGTSMGGIVTAYLLMYRIDAQNIALKMNELEDTEWLTPRKLKKMKEFAVTDWAHAGDKPDGIVIGADKKSKGVELITTSQLHALIVGTTGSGKTTSFVDQNIAVLSASAGKPSLLITDPKKELYEKHAESLKTRGYNIKVLDLREPYSSEHWNPMNVLLRRIRMIKDLENNLQNKDGKYYGAGEVFLSYGDARTRVQELKDEIYENAMDLVYTICPVQNKDQPTWEEGARNLLFGFVLAMCEDCIKGRLEEKQLVLFNLYHNITRYCSEDTSELKQYLFDGRDEFSKVRGLVNTVLITSDKTLTSYLSEVNQYMQQLADDGILSITSEDDMDITGFDENPNAVFVIVPDERITRHRFVTLFITQVYKELVEKANLNSRRNETETAILKRNMYFVLDEFGNLPKIENLDNAVTVARSRGMRFLFVLQSFSQLNAKYGKDVADTVKSNCNIKIFIGSDDPETRKEFSELCGQKKIKSLSVNTTVETSASSNTGAQNQPLITVGMLERLNGNEKGDAIVSVRGYEPIWSRFTPSYELKDTYFSAGKTDMSKREATFFDKSAFLFDISGNAESMEDILLDAIERDDMNYVSEQKSKMDKLDEEWQDTKRVMDRQIKEVARFLDKEDATALVEAPLERKVDLLFLLLRRNIEEFKKDKLKQLIKNIKAAQQQMLELQEKARSLQ